MRNQKEMAHFYFKMKTTLNSEPYIQQKYATGMKGKPIFSYEGKTKKICCQQDYLKKKSKESALNRRKHQRRDLRTSGRRKGNKQKCK